MKAVRFEHYGGPDVLNVVEVADPVPGAEEVIVRVKTTGINPGEASIREGLMHARWPATFPSGQGSDLAGVITQLGSGVSGWQIGDEVIGFTNNRASHAELVVVEADNLTRRPAQVDWDQAGALFVAGSTAWAAVRAVAPTEGDVVVVSGAAGGVGTLAAQLARSHGASVIGLASESHHAWLRAHDLIPVAYGPGVRTRIDAAADGAVTAFIDTFGAPYVELALELGVAPERIDTIADFEAIGQRGVKGDGSAQGASAAVLTELAALIADGKLEVPIARTYPLGQVRDAYSELARRHTLGKIVLHP